MSVEGEKERELVSSIVHFSSRLACNSVHPVSLRVHVRVRCRASMYPQRFSERSLPRENEDSIVLRIIVGRPCQHLTFVVLSFPLTSQREQSFSKRENKREIEIDIDRERKNT